MNLRSTLKTLLCFVLGLPLLQAVFSWVVGLLEAMGDADAANALGHVNTALRVLWLVCIVGLVVVLALQNVSEKKEDEQL